MNDNPNPPAGTPPLPVSPEPPAPVAEAGRAPGGLREVIFLFFRLGVTAFGGPAAHIAMYHDEVVKRRNWVSEQHFLDMLGATNLIPGPNSTEMTMHLGYVRAGWRGLLAAGISFILPAAVIVGVLAALYVEYGATPAAGSLLYGIKPVIIAVILQAIWNLGRRAVKTPLLGLVGAGVFSLYLLGINELLLLFGGALLVLLVEVVRVMMQRGVTPALLLALPGMSGLWAIQQVSELAAKVPVSLGELFLTFLKIGSVIYGSGYVLLAFLRTDFVERLGWLTDQQLLDAVAIGQVTPGPVFTTATFIGYVTAGLPGAVLATLAIFLPGFIFVAISNPLIPRMRQSKWLSALLDGVNVAAIGLMAAVTVELGQAALIDPLTILLALAAAVALIRFKVNSTWLIAAGGLVGLLAGAAGLVSP